MRSDQLPAHEELALARAPLCEGATTALAAKVSNEIRLWGPWPTRSGRNRRPSPRTPRPH